MQLYHPKVSKCYGCGIFLKPNNVISETRNEIFASNKVREYNEEEKNKFSQYPQNVYIKVHDQDLCACLRKKFNFHVEVLPNLNAMHVAEILYDCKSVHLAPYLT